MHSQQASIEYLSLYVKHSVLSDVRNTRFSETGGFLFSENVEFRKWLLVHWLFESLIQR